MKTTMKHIAVVALAGLALAQSAQAVDLSKVPDLRGKGLDKVNKEGFLRDERPKHCTYANDKRIDDPACYDFVLAVGEADVRYADTNILLGKPLTEWNKAKENKEGLQTVINKIKSVYAGTEDLFLIRNLNWIVV